MERYVYNERECTKYIPPDWFIKVGRCSENGLECYCGGDKAQCHSGLYNSPADYWKEG